MREYVLCDPCEQRVSAWENHGSTLLAQEDGSFPWIDRSNIILRAGDNQELGVADSSALEPEKLLLFASSVVWRASLSTVAWIDGVAALVRGAPTDPVSPRGRAA